MYSPKRYKNDDPNFIYNFVRDHPFATIIVRGKQLLATHVPVLIEGEKEDYRLFAHIANHNPMKEFLEDEAEMLLIFSGPDAYVSSSWYTDIDIPTWDYTAVHINARIRLQDTDELQTSLEKLIDHFERDQEKPLKYNDIPKNIWDENFKEITGFWLEPFQTKGIEKLHQGFNKDDIQNITEKLGTISGCPQKQLSNLIKKKHDTNN